MARLTRWVPTVWASRPAEEPKAEPQLWATATSAARRIEKMYGAVNLGWDDFEWRMVNGKLSALRWVLGDEWDFLDTWARLGADVGCERI